MLLSVLVVRKAIHSVLTFLINRVVLQRDFCLRNIYTKNLQKS